MKWIFYRCVELKYLDFSNFNTSLVSNYQAMFTSFKLCKYINLYIFKILNEAEIDYFFDAISKDSLICINDDETKEKINLFWLNFLFVMIYVLKIIVRYN